MSKKKNTQTAKDNKYNFILKNVDTGRIDNTYGLTGIGKNIPKNVTRLSELNSCKHEVISFLDDSKRTHTANLLMVDINNLNHSSQYHCFWDHHPIGNVKPIGCPIEYVFSQGIRDYISEISKNRYIIRENLTPKSLEKINRKVDSEENESNTTIKEDYYLTDGIFCSFNCCLAFIKNNFRNPRYKNSEQLLYKMYYELFQTKVERITPANDWRVLNVYGGKVSIEKFRQNLESIEYTSKGIIKMRPIAHIYEEKYKL